jgi:hypothetical protein
MANSDSNTNNAQTSKYVDLLDEDKPVAGQKFTCISFLSPDKLLKKRELYFFEKFLKHYDFEKSMTKFHQFLNFVSYKYNLDFEKLNADYQEFVKTEKEMLSDTTVDDDYKNFVDVHEEQLSKEFGEKHNFQTSVRGIKVRGSFPTQQEAELRCRMLREQDPHHDIFVGPVGVWMPWEPEAYKTGKVEYLEKELNQLMAEKQKNESQAKDEFDARVRESKRKAIEENVKNAMESGNKLTQTVNEDGELVNAGNTNTTQRALEENEVVTSADIKRELFEGDNVKRD